jgi:hypothetical protein
MVTVDQVRRFAMTLPRTTEALVGGRVKFRVGRIVYVSFSRDERVMGFGFPKEERDWLVGGDPAKFLLPGRSDLRYHWVLVRLEAIDEKEMRELVLDAWRMCVPKRVAAEYVEMVDLSSHNANPPGVFDGEAVPLSDVADTRIAECVAALRRFVAEHGSLPTAESWTEAAMRPSEKTIRRRFGSFEAAVQCSGVDFVDPV